MAGVDPEAVDEVVGDLEALGYAARAIPLAPSVEDLGPASLIAIVTVGQEVGSVAFAEAVRRANVFAATPVLWVTSSLDGSPLRRRVELYDDFLEMPYAAPSLRTRLRLVRARSGHPDFEVLRRGGLELNLSTFQTTIDGRPLELTYMEHQLLRFLASAPSRVHTRQAILQSVWDYDYYGGMRTVDVHVRRLRAKLGPENESLIGTVRNVGYR
ncbi:MAG TPA: response regulator transcription factor, partial [Acidimicrobiales bacterium]|nr:response regulator transcription factor [Acidimicrobiales bacterium]